MSESELPDLRVEPEAQREAVTLRYCHGWSLEDISRQLGRTPSAVSGLLKRGSRQLREMPEDHGTAIHRDDLESPLFDGGYTVRGRRRGSGRQTMRS